MVFRQRQRGKNCQAPGSTGVGGKTKVLKKVWVWAKEAIPHVRNKLFLDQTRDGHSLAPGSKIGQGRGVGEIMVLD